MKMNLCRVIRGWGCSDWMSGCRGAETKEPAGSLPRANRSRPSLPGSWRTVPMTRPSCCTAKGRWTWNPLRHGLENLLLWKDQRISIVRRIHKTEGSAEAAEKRLRMPACSEWCFELRPARPGRSRTTTRCWSSDQAVNGFGWEINSKIIRKSEFQRHLHDREYFREYNRAFGKVLVEYSCLCFVAGTKKREKFIFTPRLQHPTAFSIPEPSQKAIKDWNRNSPWIFHECCQYSQNQRLSRAVGQNFRVQQYIWLIRHRRSRSTLLINRKQNILWNSILGW